MEVFLSGSEFGFRSTVVEAEAVIAGLDDDAMMAHAVEQQTSSSLRSRVGLQLMVRISIIRRFAVLLKRIFRPKFLGYTAIDEKLCSPYRNHCTLQGILISGLLDICDPVECKVLKQVTRRFKSRGSATPGNRSAQ